MPLQETVLLEPTEVKSDVIAGALHSHYSVNRRSVVSLYKAKNQILTKT
jgi:hypothetical protein